VPASSDFVADNARFFTEPLPGRDGRRAGRRGERRRTARRGHDFVAGYEAEAA
jgi:hypothetical protein